MATVNIYLNFNGNCEDAFGFYKSVFGGEFSYLGRFKDMPMSENQTVISEEQGNKIMHITLPISQETSLMGCDTDPHWGMPFVQGNNFSISIDSTSKEEADMLFNKLHEGGMSIMPMNQTFWGSYFGMCVDKFGINWMISFEKK